MPILPVDTGRYGTPEMRRIFEEETRVQKMLDVEAALAWAHAEVGDISKLDAERVMAVALLKNVKLERIKEIEREVKHDVAALVSALSEACGSSGGCVHLGATSYDIVDTANALQLKEAVDLVERRLGDLEKTLIEKSGRYRETIMVGRTHGQHALPITLGFKFAVWMRDISRHKQRLKQCRERVLVGKMTGAVGTQAGFGSHAQQIQELVMKRLGLKAADISTQIVQRDRYAELICINASIVTSLENFAAEIRELQRPEIGELAEYFDVAKQVGSSAMPHKQNPELCERVCGLARIVRSLSIPSLENIITWHERDLTQSSAERFILPESCILTDYLLFTFDGILKNLRVFEQRMTGNLGATSGRNMSEAVMTALVKKGMNRQEAHELLRRLSAKSQSENVAFLDVLLEDDTVCSLLSRKEAEDALNPRNYLGTAVKQVEMMIEKTKKEL